MHGHFAGPGRVVRCAARTSPLGYLCLVGWQLAWLPTPRGHSVVRLRDGRVLRCDLSDRTQRTMYLGLFEPAETRLVASILQPGDVFIDIGAHIGWFTTLAARRVGPDGQVVACEPYPSNAAALRANVALNRADNVRVVELAMGSQAGTLSLASVGGESGGVTALDWAHDGRIDVPMTTLDAIAAGVNNIALIKLDVEGWEPRVLGGAVDALSRTRHVLMEINGPSLRAAGSSKAEVLELLRDRGFSQIRPVVQTGLRRFHRSAVSNVLASR